MAGNSLGTGVVTLTADAKGLTAGLSDAQSRLSGFVVGINKSVSLITQNPAIAAAKLAFDAVSGAVRHFVSEFAQMEGANRHLQNMSKTFGLSMEQMTGLDGVAKMAGISVDDFGAAMKHASVFLSEVHSGGSEATDTLNKLGLSVSQFKDKDTYQSFMLIADALNKVGDSSDRFALSKNIFGKGAISVDPMLQLGSAGIGSAQKEMERVGQVYGPETAGKLDEAGESLHKLEMAWEGLKREVFADSASYIKDLLESITDLVVGIKDLVHWWSQLDLFGGADSHKGMSTQGENGFKKTMGYIMALPAALSGSQSWMDRMGGWIAGVDVDKMSKPNVAKPRTKTPAEIARDKLLADNKKQENMLNEHFTGLWGSLTPDPLASLKKSGINDAGLARAKGMQHDFDITKFEDGLKDSIKYSGMTNDEIEKMKLGMTDTEKRTSKYLDTLIRAKEVLEAGNSALVRKSPFSQTLDELEGLQKLRGSGNISDDQYLLSLGKMAGGIGPAPNNVAAEFGSVDAAKSLIAFNAPSARQDGAAAIKALLEQQKVIQDQQLQAGREAAQYLKTISDNSGNVYPQT